jgi:aminotransferase
MSERDRISAMARDLPPSGIREFFDLVMGMDDVISLRPISHPGTSGRRHRLAPRYDLLHQQLGPDGARAAIARDMVPLDEIQPTEQIIVTVGADGADLTMRALLDPGDGSSSPSLASLLISSVIMAGGCRDRVQRE